MGDEPYFDGDPAIDSTRHRMERVLKGEPPPRRWPLILAALGGGGLLWMWQAGRAARAKLDESAVSEDPARRHDV